MPHFVGYLQVSGVAQVKAECDICHMKYGSIEQAQACESRHIQTALQNAIEKNLVNSCPEPRGEG